MSVFIAIYIHGLLVHERYVRIVIGCCQELHTDICSIHFVADKYRVWLLVYAPYVLYRLSTICHPSFRLKIKGTGLTKAHLDNFYAFHMACRLILQPSMKREDVTMAHKYFLEYNQSFVKLFTAEMVKPYNHLLLHLSQNILDFSSVVHTWCFAYERYYS